jgi:FKBP-type peptidyl-prolyl cis-trans isomerase
MEIARKKDFQIKMEKDSIENIQILAKEDKELQAYFKKNNITGLQKTKLGTYVQITQPGTGAMIDTTVVVETKYTGSLLNGKKFDSNIDSTFKHTEPFNVNMTNDYTLGGPVIKGWTDGLKLLNKGAKAKFYVPSVLGYGKQAMGELIAENSILIFDIEVSNVLTKVQAKAFNDSKLRLKKDIEKKFYDSLQNATGKQK